MRVLAFKAEMTAVMAARAAVRFFSSNIFVVLEVQWILLSRPVEIIRSSRLAVRSLLTNPNRLRRALLTPLVLWHHSQHVRLLPKSRLAASRLQRAVLAFDSIWVIETHQLTGNLQIVRFQHFLR